MHNLVFQEAKTQIASTAEKPTDGKAIMIVIHIWRSRADERGATNSASPPLREQHGRERGSG
jgi:hypothetical protein